MNEEPRRASLPPTSLDLLTRFRTGDGDAFAELYRRHSPPVFRFALYMTSDAARADEITQDVFVWLVHNPAAFDPSRGELSAFLTGVARKFLQHRQRDDRRWAPLAGVLMETALAESAPRGEAAVEAAMLRNAIATLPPRYREVVALCDLEGFSYEEAAAALACVPGTVRSRLHRARAFLARKLNPKKEACRA